MLLHQKQTPVALQQQPLCCCYTVNRLQLCCSSNTTDCTGAKAATATLLLRHTAAVLQNQHQDMLAHRLKTALTLQQQQPLLL